MTESYERTKVLITVMTYPHPSKRHQEVVCTAGITEQGDWVRLYPINHRYRPKHQQFHKYQWIEIDLLPRGSRTLILSKFRARHFRRRMRGKSGARSLIRCLTARATSSWHYTRASAYHWA